MGSDGLLVLGSITDSEALVVSDVPDIEATGTSGCLGTIQFGYLFSYH
ncbi:4847_t:CDS:2 [Racocetra fulgida]|uniref:4847_t:CDS:1 n=1 Tax=Racocetra fulgida TaxID=60492 RepID=A0A9N8ZHU9_9GLOM|nr:4847_t:CDS:2 [Racocetra fulgida]